MNLQETLALIEALRSSGVTKFKSLEHDISFDSSVQNLKKPEITTYPHPPQNSPQDSNEDISRAKELINLARMSPEELANQMFPDGAL